MIMYGDYHTHTIYTHGKGTIEDNVKQAIKMGLKQIAITEHAYTHMAFGVNRKEYKAMKAEVDELRKKYPQIEILLGLECNLLNFEGDIDITPEERKDYDIIVLGYHKTYKPTSLKNFFRFWLPNFLRFGNQSKKRIAYNTQAYVNAINKNKIDIVAHLKYLCDVDVVKVAQAAKNNGTYIEFNGKHLFFNEKEIKEMVKNKTQFIIDSDAHNPLHVGINNKAFSVIEKYKIPTELVVNLNKKPKFFNFNNKK